MRKNYNNTDRVMFKIDVKIGQRILTLNVTQGDTILGLLLKNNIAQESDHQRLEELKEKIIMNIQKQIQIKLYSNQFDLAKRMENFLNKQTGKNQQRFKQQLPSYHKNLSKEKQTPFKMLFERTQNFSNINQSLSLPKNNQLSNNKGQNEDNDSFLAQLRESTGPINPINHLNAKHRNFNQSKKKNQYSRYSQSNKKGASRKVDDDLIKAYEIILLKSKDKTMRQMAEKTLKQLKIYQHEHKTQQFKIQSHLNERYQKQNSSPLILGNVEIEQKSKQNIMGKKLSIEEFSRSRLLMRKNNKYSYLDQEINLTHEYEKRNDEKQTKQYKYLDDNQIKDQTLKKPYNMQKITDGNVRQYPVNRRYNYLYD